MKRYFAPGRINLIGEHVDYQGGWVLPAAISLGITARVQESPNHLFELSSASHPEEISFDTHQSFVFNDNHGWLNYPLGVFDFLKQKQFTLKPLRIHFETTLPQSSGLSSSAAIEVLTMYLLLHESGYRVSMKDISIWCKEVENHFIGVSCGIMDQFVIANASANHALLLNCHSLEAKNIPLSLGNKRIVILNTGKPRNLIHSKYNERKTECDTALQQINQKKLSKHSFLCQCSDSDWQLLSDETLKKRARHVMGENYRVLQAAEQLSLGNISRFEDLLNESHRSLRDDYEVSGAELDAIVQAATSHPACNAARMTGAGFGGCAIALVEEDHIDEFCHFVIQKYLLSTGYKAECYLCHIADGVKLIG
jgi:galactokinase